MSTPAETFDVAVIGGALSGAATALVLKRERPELRILIVEKSTVFTRRVGEATVEVSTYFLTKILGLTQYLNETQLVKQGMRFWFFNGQTQTLEDCSEVGGRMLARIISFQVDRSKLEQEILDRAAKEGIVLWRPADVLEVELNAGGQQKLQVRHQGEIRSVEARWVIDGSGVAAFLARRNGWLRANAEHPTSALWSRWKGVKDWDGLELAKKFPKWHQACYGVRNTATNHVVGDGWWAWFIPLKGGDASVGLVIDQRTAKLPEDGSLGERLKRFLDQHPVAREMLADAQFEEGDVHWRKNLPYSSAVFAGDGFALVGDAAGFLDPLYSPGLDWLAFTSLTSARLVLTQQKGEPIAELLEKHNRTFARSYDRWFLGIYKDKYDYIGEYDLMRVAFILDIGMYYTGVAAQPFRRGLESYYEPIFSTGPSTPFYWLMRTYNRRFAAMARDRRRRNQRGLTNAHRRFLFPGFSFTLSTKVRIVKGLLGWLRLELKEGWRTWGRHNTQPALPSKVSGSLPQLRSEPVPRS